jgi:beta-phosphoglucomutase family hydrolase
MNSADNSIMIGGRAIRGVIFDMDGVVADTFAAHQEAWGAFLKREGFTEDPAVFLRRTFGQGNPQILRSLYGDHITADFIDQKAVEKESLFVAICREGHVRPVAGVREFLSRLKARGLRLAVGTSAPRMNLVAILEAFNMEDVFDVLVSCEDVEHAKPAPDIFLCACERLQLPPTDCVVFEDSVHGLEAARAAGCRVVGIATTHPEHEIASRCELAVRDFEALMRQAEWSLQ